MTKSKYFFMLMATFVAISSLSLTACGGDDDDYDTGGSAKKYYTYQLNGETYYYGGTFGIYGTSIGASYDLQNDFYELGSDRAYFSFGGQDVPLRSMKDNFDEDGNMLAPNWNYSVSVMLVFKKFNPKTMKEGEELEVIQVVKSHRTDSNDPKYLFDFLNDFEIEDMKTSRIKDYTWRGPAVGKIRFVSYTDHPDGTRKLITLEFDHVTFEEYQGSDYSTFPYKAKTVTINGEISFQG